MHAVTLDHHFANLDLTNAADLLIAFHLARHWPRTPPMDELEGTRQLEVIQHFAPMIFGVPDHEQTREVIQTFIEELGGKDKSVRVDGAGLSRPKAPRQWLHVFREAFHRETITPYAFGVAFRMFMVRTAGNGAPQRAADSLEARRAMLHDARQMDPRGAMSEVERQILANAPEFVTLWRGGFGPCGAAAIDLAQGLHWTPERDYAEVYMRGRKAEHVLKSAYKNSLAALTIGNQAGLRSPAAPDLREPFLLQATVPRELMLCFVAAGPTREHIEVFVDFEKLTPDMVNNFTPYRVVRENAHWRHTKRQAMGA